MDGIAAHRLVDALLAVERGVGERDAVVAGLDAASRLRSFVDAAEASLLTEMRRLQTEGRAESPVEAAATCGRRSSAEARAANRRAAACDDVPELHEALADGTITAGHVDAFAHATGRLSDAARSQLRLRATELVSAAAGMTVDEFATTCVTAAREASVDDGVSAQERLRHQRNVRRWVDRDTGMHLTRIALDPRTDESMWSVINHVVRARHAAGGDRADATSWDHAAVDTIVELITRHQVAPVPPLVPPHQDLAPAATLSSPIADSAPSAAIVNPVAAAAAGDLLERIRQLDEREAPGCERAAADPPSRSPSGRSAGPAPPDRLITGRVPEIGILIDWTALRGDAVAAGVLCETIDGHPIPVAEVRRLACHADLYPIVLDGDGIPLDLGRSQRLASPEQRKALAAMYATCYFPGCSIPVRQTEAHHVDEWWTQTGPTDLDRLLPACGGHHHLLHEGGWRLELRPDRTIRLTRPDGTTHYDGPSTNRRPPPACRRRGTP